MIVISGKSVMKINREESFLDYLSDNLVLAFVQSVLLGFLIGCWLAYIVHFGLLIIHWISEAT